MDGYGITESQYHAGLDKLWNAIGHEYKGHEDIFTIVSGYIKNADELIIFIQDALALMEKAGAFDNNLLDSKIIESIQLKIESFRV